MEKFLYLRSKDKDYLKLSRELTYWGLSTHDSDIAIKHKRTNIMDAIRYLKIYFADVFEKNPNLTETFYEDLYDEFSNLTHPASDSILMYVKNIEEKWNSSGFKAEVAYSKNINEQHFYNIAYIFNIISNHLVSDLYPKYIDNVINRFQDMREYTIKYFSLNPEYAKEILDLSIDKQKIDKKRKDQGLEDIDKLMFENFTKK